MPISLDTIIIYYNQPMQNDGGGGSIDSSVHYRLRNLANNQSIPITDISYNPYNYELTLTFNNNDPDWDYNSTYELWIQASIKNSCGVPQGGAVTTNFTTQSPGMTSSQGLSGLSSALIPISAQASTPTSTTPLISVPIDLQRFNTPFFLSGEHIYFDTAILWLWSSWLESR